MSALTVLLVSDDPALLADEAGGRSAGCRVVLLRDGREVES